MSLTSFSMCFGYLKSQDLRDPDLMLKSLKIENGVLNTSTCFKATLDTR